jgi:hypothetical protein
MEGVGQIMNPGVVLSVAQVPIVEAPSMAVGVGSSMEGMQTGPQISEVASQFDSPKPEEVGSRDQSTREILDLAKDKGYDAAFEKMAQGDFGEKVDGESIDPMQEEPTNQIEDRVQILEEKVSELLQLKENSAKMAEKMAFELQALTLEELIALAIVLQKRLEKEKEDKGLFDALIALMGMLLQAMVEPEVIGEGFAKKTNNSEKVQKAA